MICSMTSMGLAMPPGPEGVPDLIDFVAQVTGEHGAVWRGLWESLRVCHAELQLLGPGQFEAFCPYLSASWKAQAAQFI